MDSKEKAWESLKAKQEELTSRLARIRSERHRAAQPLSADFSEQAVERENDEVLELLELATEKDLLQTTHALTRLEEGGYGQCEKCGLQIDADRLRAVPQATYCAPCARIRID